MRGENRQGIEKNYTRVNALGWLEEESRKLFLPETWGSLHTYLHLVRREHDQRDLAWQ